MNRTIVAVIAGLAAVLLLLGALTAGEDEAAAPEPRERSSGPSVARIAREVERLRELDFERLPELRSASRREAERYVLRLLDEEIPAEQLRAGEEAMKLLGLIGPDDDLRAIFSELARQEIAGLYDPKADRMLVVEDAVSGGLEREMVLAHELVHALEDQHYGLETPDQPQAVDDQVMATGALREGTATVVMIDYLGLEQPRAQLLGEITEFAAAAPSDLPRYVNESLVFPYATGARFVDRVQRRGGWAAVDRVIEDAPPASSEQLMHPAKYDRREAPRRVSIGEVAALLPAGAERAGAGTLGEFDTVQVLLGAEGGGPAARRRAERAGAGWGGGRYELWRWGDEAALVAAWTWDTERDAAEFERAARAWLAGRPWATALSRSGARVAVVLTPAGVPAEPIAQSVLDRG